MVNPAKELEILRKNLLDLTLRNRLINYLPSKRRTIEITDESPREIYDILVIQEKSMVFYGHIVDNGVFHFLRYTAV